MAALIYTWKPSFMSVDDSSAKRFAALLERALRQGMVRRRLGGTDCFSIFRKVLQDTADKENDRLLVGDLEAKMTVVYDGLRLLALYHPYGEHINAELIIGRIQAGIRGDLPEACEDDIDITVTAVE